MTTNLLMALTTGAGLALAASAHCVLMCGPLAMMSHARGGHAASARYLAGRLVSYTLVGALAGSAGRALTALPGAHWVEATLSALLAAALVMAAYKLVRPAAPPGPIRLGRAPRKTVVGRALALVADDPLLLGAATALLPCGALLGAVAASAALGSAGEGALAMATFSLLSGLGLVGAGKVAQLIALGKRGKLVLAAVLCVGAALMMWRPLSALRSPQGVPACHLHAEAL